MPKLCVVLTSDYTDRRESEAAVWISETNEDLQTIREVFSQKEDYLLQGHPNILNIEILTTAKPQAVEKQVKQALEALSLSQVESCHIVINSHGIAAKKDLQDLAVVTIVKTMSTAGIPVCQISALICNAMSPEGDDDRRSRLESSGHNYEYLIMEGVKTPIKKTSTMNILKAKLDKTKTAVSQSFRIYGPDRAYFPSEDKALVTSVLNGEPGIPYLTAVTTEEVFDVTLYKSEVFKANEFVKQHAHSSQALSKEDKKTYEKSTNLLGKVLDRMYKQLVKHFGEDPISSPEAQLLHDSLMLHVSKNSSTFKSLNAENLKCVYKHWKDNIKVYTEERTKLMTNYSQIDDVFFSPVSSRESTPFSSPSSSRNSSPFSPLQAPEAQSSFTPIVSRFSFFKTSDTTENPSDIKEEKQKP